jgi:hypothetical protein
LAMFFCWRINCMRAYLILIGLLIASTVSCSDNRESHNNASAGVAAVTSISLHVCDFINYRQQGCPSGLVCFQGSSEPCGPQDKTCPSVGDGFCHSICTTNDACQTGERCLTQPLFWGDIQVFNGSMCVTDPRP